MTYENLDDFIIYFSKKINILSNYELNNEHKNSIFEKKQSTDFCQSIIETSNFVIRGIGLAAGYGLLQGQGLSRTPIDKPILNTN